MPFAWKEYLELAQNLRGYAGPSFSSEASGRSAVSRAYYAAFCTARNYAEANFCFQRTGTPEDHKALIVCLEQHGREYTRVARRLRELRMWRNQCDYDDDVVNLASMIDAAINSARVIFDECQ